MSNISSFHRQPNSCSSCFCALKLFRLFKCWRFILRERTREREREFCFFADLSKHVSSAYTFSHLKGRKLGNYSAFFMYRLIASWCHLLTGGCCCKLKFCKFKSRSKRTTIVRLKMPTTTTARIVAAASTTTAPNLLRAVTYIKRTACFGH